MASIGKLTANLELQSAAFIRDLSRAQQAVATNTAKMSRQMREVVTASRGVERQMASLRRGILSATTAVAAFGAASVVRGIISTSAEFEKLRASLNTVTGSAEAAAAAFAQIQDFAAKTPFDVQQATEAFIRMKSLGLDASRDSMVSFANTASAMGKSLIQFTEAVADATTGEFERLKEFGIKASSEADKVTFTFRGVATTIGKNAEEITKYLKQIGEVEFAGAAKEQADKLGGALSNLGDSAARFSDRIGQGGVAAAVQDLSREFSAAADGASGLAADIGANVGAGIRAAGEAARFTATHLREITAAIAAFAAYKVGAMFAATAVAVGKLAKSILVARTAVEALNIAIRKNPIGLLASAAAIGAASLIEFSGSKDEATEAAKRHAKALETETGKIGDQTKSLREAQRAALEQTVALSEARAKAFKEIQEIRDAGMTAVSPGGSFVSTDGTEINALELQFRDLKTAITEEEQAAERARQQLADMAKTTKETATSTQATAEMTDKQVTAFQRLEESLLPAVKAQREYEESLKLINAALNAGQVTFMQYNVMLEQLQINLDEATNGTKALEEAQRKAAETAANARSANDQIRAETQAILDGAKAWDAYKQSRSVADNAADLARDLKNAGVGADEIKRLVEERKFLLESQQQAAEKLQQEQALYNELEGIGSRAFDRIGSSITQMFVEGKSSALTFKNVMLGVVSEIAQSFIQLAAINPLKNALFGTNAATLGSSALGGLFGGFDTSMSSSLVQTGGSGVIGRSFVGPFADGGSFMVGSGLPSINAGRDNRLVSFAARDGEKVTVETPGQQRMRSGEGMSMRSSGGDINVYPDMRGASVEAVEALHKMVKSLNASIEGRSVKAVADAQRRGRPAMRGAFG